MREKLKIINRDQLKYIAAFFMFAGHFLLATIAELHFCGFPSAIYSPLIRLVYIAPPIFMFLFQKVLFIRRIKQSMQ